MHVLGTTWRIQFGPATPDMAAQDAVLVQADWDGQPLLCALPRGTLACALALRLRKESHPPLNAWPDAFLAAGLTSTLKMLRRYVRLVYQGRLSGMRTVPAADNGELASGLQLVLSSPDRSRKLTFCMWADAATLADLAGMFAMPPFPQAEAHEVEHRQQIDAIPLTGKLIAATLRLTTGELASLDIGDVLLPRPLAAASQQGGFLRLSKALGLSVHIYHASDVQEVSEMNYAVHNATLFAHQALQPTENTVPAASPGPEQCQPVDALEILLSFEIGRADFTVGQLRELSPGAILNVSAAAPGNVDIHANGRLIGRGLIVEIDGCTGVQLTEFAARE